MKMMYKFARFPRDKKLLQDINRGATLLFDKLSVLDVDALDVSDYNKRYLKRYQHKLRTHLQRLAYLLSWTLHSENKPLSEIVMVDYGGGSGLLSLLAKACGVGTVIYNDIFDVSCQDAATVGEKLSLKPDHFVAGDIDALNKYLTSNNLKCDALVSCDVLEHIYDLEVFFKSLHQLSNQSFNYVISTHANPMNPIINRSLMKLQVIAETVEKEAGYGHKSRDSLRSFLNARKDILEEAFQDQLSQTEIDKLASYTRGMHKSDIEQSAGLYMATKQMPTPLTHPTNTCDPYTGNWADRLTSPFEIQNLLMDTGFTATVLSCHHGDPKNLPKRLLANILDIMMRVSGRQGLRLASYFMLYGTKK